MGYALGIPVDSYLGYTMSDLEPDLSVAARAEKDEIARWYVANRRCRTTGTCANISPYRGRLRHDWSLWIARQYRQVHRAPRPGEILGDIGRTTSGTGRDPARCLHADGGPGGAVSIRGCDGSDSQKWAFGPGDTIRLGTDRTSCLTAVGGTAALRPCRSGDRAQEWRRDPWRSATWKRKAWRIVTNGGGDRCLYQDDLELPAAWNDRDPSSPRLVLAPCGTIPRPELYWRWKP
ncbi:ricin-type beta-trefoil lectin domain protein [Streptomyces sp. NPDC058953]|uniref:ricin-type beta-trefoil lectin domain protein n=1 Tax=Streptomyces sp. NPDC058953 TaxID=3346676 RepID=UPI00367D394A